MGISKVEYFDLSDREKQELESQISSLTISIMKRQELIRQEKEAIKAESLERNDLAYALENCIKPEAIDATAQL